MSAPTASPELPDLDRLEALARAATPGPWTVRLDGTCSGTWPHVDAGVDEYGDPITVTELSTSHTETEAARLSGDMPGSYEEAPHRFKLHDQQSLDDAAFIAAANPEQVLALIALARRAKPEGEVPQADQWRKYACKLRSTLYGIAKSFDDHELRQCAQEAYDWDTPAAQHAESGAPAADEQSRRQQENAVFTEWWISSGQQAAHDLTTENAAHATWQERARRAALAAQSQGAQAAQLCIGFANNDQGVHVSVMQQNSDGSATVLHAGKVPGGDSFARFTLAAKAEAPAHETIVQQAGELVCTACGTSAQQAAAPGAEPVEPPRMTANQSREYLVDFMEKHFTDKTYHRYIRGERDSVNLAADFAWQMARALRMLEAAPSAPGTPEAPQKPAHGHRDDYYLLANGRRLGLEPVSRVRNMPNWALAMELFATGSGSAYQICRDAGVDPESTTTQRAAQLDGGQEGSGKV